MMLCVNRLTCTAGPAALWFRCRSIRFCIGRIETFSTFEPFPIATFQCTGCGTTEFEVCLFISGFCAGAVSGVRRLSVATIRRSIGE